MSTQTVLISGAGIAGPTVAYWLQRAGFTPTIVERAPRLRTAGYVIDFWGLGYEIADRMGLGEAIQRVGYHVRKVRFVDDHGQRASGFGTDVFADMAGGRFITLGRSDLSRIIFEKLQEIEVLFGDEVTAMSEEADSVRVQFQHAGERHFDLVIGADGLHSNIRNLAFGLDHLEKQLGYTVAAFEVAGYRPRDEDVYLIYGSPGTMVGRFTLHDDRTLFLIVLTDDDVASGPLPSLESQKAILRRRLSGGKWECERILAELDKTPELYFDRVSQIQMDHWSKGRIALLGDAAFCVSLLAGQGSALAMTSAYILAGELANAGGNYALAFRRYEDLLRSYVGMKQAGAERLATSLVPRTRFGLFFRNRVVNALGTIPGLAKWAFGSELIDKLKLPEYNWQTQMPTPTAEAKPAPAP
ncbi:MAG: FAD-binding domain [Acidobacteriota bacterium]